MARQFKRERVNGTGSVFWNERSQRWIAIRSFGTPPNRVRKTRHARTREEAERLLQEMGGGQSLEEAFWLRVDKSGDCWVFRGLKDRYGYGRFRGERAHRLVLKWSGIDIEGLSVLHSCDNPPCVNPAHLRAGTQSDNFRDMYARGRRTPPNRWLHR